MTERTDYLKAKYRCLATEERIDRLYEKLTRLEQIDLNSTPINQLERYYSSSTWVLDELIFLIKSMPSWPIDLSAYGKFAQ